MTSHVDPAIFVSANLGELGVTAKLMRACKLKRATAIGHLVMLWGKAALHRPDGVLTDCSDEQLETWAMWDGRRGAFASWLRREHLDATGRPSEWDEYAGRLAVSRQKARDRKRSQRGLSPPCPRDNNGTDAGRHGDGPAVVPVTSHLSRAREEGRGERESEKELVIRDNTREALSLSDPQRLAIAANQAITAKWGETPRPLLPGSAATVALTQWVVESGIPIEFAAASIAGQVARKGEAPPSSMAYFRAGIDRDWQAHGAREQAAGAPVVAGLEPGVDEFTRLLAKYESASDDQPLRANNG